MEHVNDCCFRDSYKGGLLEMAVPIYRIDSNTSGMISN